MTRYSEVYQTQIDPQTGEPVSVLVSQVEILEAPDITSGEAQLIPQTGGSRVRVETKYAGRDVIITRQQDGSTQIGNVYIQTSQTIQGESFVIRSTNASDTGTIYWTLSEEL